MENKKEKRTAGTLEDLVFENRNKEYGSYYLRKKFQRYLLVGFLISFFIMATGVAVPFIKALNAEDADVVLVKETVAELQNVKTDQDAPPPPPPPPPPQAMEQQVKYTAPVVVEEAQEDVQLAIVDDVKESTTNEPPPETIEVVSASEEEVIVEEEPAFVFVEEQATFQGGTLETFREWVQKNLVYPPVAVENGIFGRVTVQFAVNSRGEVVDVKVLRGVDPSLDKETVRVIMSSPKWGPAKQGGRAVKQQFVMPVIFQLQ
ncbi:MAG TPA: TonB family protein [Bacteroidales bacterium]|jgi:protein TonB|nr:TonB family protein [Bacteroidales bacterium]